MKKLYKVIIAFILVIAAFLIIALISTRGNLSNMKYAIFGDQNFTLKSNTEQNPTDDIIIDIRNRDLEFLLSTDNFIKLEYYESEQYTYTYSYENNKIHLASTQNFSYGLFNFGKSRYHTVKVYLPTSFSGNIIGDTSNSDILLDSLNLSNIKLESSNGSIKVSNLGAQSINLKSSNGSLDLSNIHANVSVKGITNNNKVIINNITSPEVEIKTANGSIDASLITAPKLTLTTSNSIVMASQIETDNIFIDTSNGKVDLSVLGAMNDYKIEYDTSNGYAKIGDVRYGDNNILNKTSTKTIYINTSNGNIYLEFSK